MEGLVAGKEGYLALNQNQGKREKFKNLKSISDKVQKVMVLQRYNITNSSYSDIFWKLREFSKYRNERYLEIDKIT